MFRMGKSIKTESRLVILEDVGRGEWYQVFSASDELVLDLDVPAAQFCDYTNNHCTELYSR